MKLEQHVAISAICSGILFAISRSLPLAIASFLPGVLTDIDHIIDYLMQYGRRFDAKRFFRAAYRREYEKAYLCLHSWEWLLLGFAVTWIAGWNLWMLGFLLGYGQHLVVDQLINRPDKWGYSFFWRWRNDFDFKKSFPKKTVSVK